MVMGKIRYQEFHDIIFDWIEAGKLAFDGKRSTNKFTELDAFIFEALGYVFAYDDWIVAVDSFTQDINRGKLNLEWMRGPHALTLFKAMLAQRGAVKIEKAQ